MCSFVIRNSMFRCSIRVVQVVMAQTFEAMRFPAVQASNDLRMVKQASTCPGAAGWPSGREVES